MDLPSLDLSFVLGLPWGWLAVVFASFLIGIVVCFFLLRNFCRRESTASSACRALAAALAKSELEKIAYKNALSKACIENECLRKEKLFAWGVPDKF